MSELIDLIDDWRRRHGQPSEASVSRAISNSDKTVNAWRKRGIKDMPHRDTLQKLAVLLNLPIERVVMAAVKDARYLEKPATPPPPPTPVKPRATGTEGR